MKKNKQVKEKRFNRKMQKKLAVTFIVIVLALFALNIRLSFISMGSGNKYTMQVLAQQKYDSRTIPFQRGDIYDRNMTKLATSVKVYNLILDPAVILSSEENEYLEPTVNALVASFGLDKQQLLQTIQEKKDSSYVVQLKGLTYEQVKKFTDMQSDTENKKSQFIKGVWFEHEYIRTYPFSTLACDVIGFTSKGNVGNWGIEQYYNSYLNGVDGREYGYLNDENALERTIISPTNGNNIVSTIDINIQNIVEKNINSYIDQYHPKNVAIVVADPNSGEILAMAGNKSYDLNNPRDLSQFYTTDQIAAMNDEQTLEALNGIWRNFCISDTYEPGSTIKPFTIGMALEEGVISQNTTFLCDGGEEVGGWKISCWKKTGHGQITVEQAIMYSCNDALMQIAGLSGVDRFTKYISDYGFGSKTGIDLPGESGAEGLMKSSADMSASDLATNAFGQNFNVTMIQMVSGFSSLINGGFYYEPHVVKQILDENGSQVTNIEKNIVKQTVTASTSTFLREAMYKVVSEGTGSAAAVAGYKVGGKTGTAEKLPRGQDKYVLSFLGFAPIDNPKVVCYVLVDEPQVDNPSSSSYASALFSKVMTEVLPYMNIFPTEQVPVQEPETTVQQPTEPETTQTVEQETEMTVVNTGQNEVYEGSAFEETTN